MNQSFYVGIQEAALTTEAETALEAVVVGDVLNVEAVMAWFNGPQMYYTSSTVLTAGTLTDADKAAIDAADLEVDAAFAEATTITYLQLVIKVQALLGPHQMTLILT